MCLRCVALRCVAMAYSCLYSCLSVSSASSGVRRKGVVGGKGGRVEGLEGVQVVEVMDGWEGVKGSTAKSVVV